jgi:uncharacterized membrane protein YsdA (DUF1294 family)
MFGPDISISKVLMLLGCLVFVLGILIHYFGNVFSWVGSLPGDIKIKKENFSFYFPITSMILLSLLLNIIFRLFTKINS